MTSTRELGGLIVLGMLVSLAASPGSLPSMPTGTGRIVVNHDEWTLSNAGFAWTPTDAPQFALNVASWFAEGGPGNFLVYSDNFGLTESQLAATMNGAGHTWTVSTSVPFTLSTLLAYDAVFLAGFAADSQVLIDYVDAGGGVYLAGGTGGPGGPFQEAALWNTFLNEFGLNFGAPYNDVIGVLPITSSHPIFAGVQALYQVNGSSVSELDPSDPNTDILEFAGEHGLYGVYEAGDAPPNADAGPDQVVHEGGALTFNGGNSSDDTGIVSYEWDLYDYLDTDGDGDPTNDVDATGPTPTWTYGDDGVYSVTLRVTDSVGQVASDTMTVTVLNVPPTIDIDVQSYATGDLTLRVAGEKWHDATLTLYEDGVEVATATVYRVPGDPDAQAATIEDVTIDLLGPTWSAVVEYTPLDDPVNGQPLGANPAWLIFTTEDGSESRLHHTFNVRHEDTWTWEVDDLSSLLVGLPITFEATASDPGSDDLIFTWSWGDGTPDTVTTYYNDGIGPDPFPSPDVNPLEVTDSVNHVFGTLRSYVLALTVEDDDGGSTVTSVSLSL